MNSDDYNSMEGPCKAGWVIWPWLVYATIGAVLALMAWYLLPGLIVKQALAHESMSHMQYDKWCCNGTQHTGDCQEIPDEAVRTIPGGYQITLKAGDHRLVTRVHVWEKAQTETRWSTDGRYHACLFPTESTLRCFYAPPPSF